MRNQSIIYALFTIIIIVSFQNCSPMGVALSISDLSLIMPTGSSNEIFEGDEVEIELHVASPEATDVTYSIVVPNSTSDVQLPVSEVVLPANQVSLKFKVRALTDNEVERPETVYLYVEQKNNASIRSSEFSLIIMDRPVLPVLSMSNISIQEGGSANLTVRASFAVNEDIIFDLEKSGGTASNNDYEIADLDEIVIPRNTTSVNIPVNAVSDSATEANETVIIRIINARNAVAPSASTTITLSDNVVLPTLSLATVSGVEGTALTFTATLSSAATAPVTFNFSTQNGTAIAGTHFTAASGQRTIAVGQTTASITVQGLQGNATSTMRFTLQITNITGAANTTAQAEGAFIDSPNCDNQSRIQLAGVFQSNMVLHEDSPRIWGQARPSSDVVVSLRNRTGAEVTVRSDANGKFLATIPVNNIASGSTEIVVTNTCETDVISNVKIGEVWLCSGQSNMAWNVESSSTSDEVLTDIQTTAVQDNIRIFQVAQDTSRFTCNLQIAKQLRPAQEQCYPL